MIIRSEDLKDICGKILNAVDASSDLAKVTETLQLEVINNNLVLSVTNREYVAKVAIDVGEEEDFFASVNATNFLKLVSQTTSDTIKLETTDRELKFTGNGTYKLGMITNDTDGSIVHIPEIEIENVTNHFSINSSVLNSILQFNSKELTKLSYYHGRDVQYYYYVDEQGAITFTTGACVNAFTLDTPVKMLLPQKLVKLFKLFKEGDVDFSMGFDAVNDDIIQTKVKFSNDTITITSILSCDDAMISSVPVSAIRGRANDVYPHSVNINREAFIQAINRLLIFAPSKPQRPYSKLVFDTDELVIYGKNDENKETLYYVNDGEISTPYELKVDLDDLKLTLDSCTEEYITLNFGNGQAIVVVRGNIKNVVPEVKR